MSRKKIAFTPDAAGFTKVLENIPLGHDLGGLELLMGKFANLTSGQLDAVVGNAAVVLTAQFMMLARVNHRDRQLRELNTVPSIELEEILLLALKRTDGGRR